MNAERLERIKNGLITGGDIPFIVEGFKRLHELEKKNKTLSDNHFQQRELTQSRVDKFYKLNMQLHRENKRLREQMDKLLQVIGIYDENKASTAVEELYKISEQSK